MLHEWLLEHRKTEADYWWFINKRRMVRRLLAQHQPERGTLLEVGCGGGLLSSRLQEEGWRVISSDLFPDAARFARAHGVAHALAFNAAAGWPFVAASVDAVIMLDVLEHVQDDLTCLREAWRVLQPGGVLLITVPAYPFLYSAWDEYNGHFRRYTARSLARAARASGFEIDRNTYWNAVSLPPAFLLRLKDRIQKVKLEHLEFPKVSRPLNRTLQVYGRLECAWIQRCALPFGLSAMAVLRKERSTA